MLAAFIIQKAEKTLSVCNDYCTLLLLGIGLPVRCFAAKKKVVAVTQLERFVRVRDARIKVMKEYRLLEVVY
jgi:hypothetical protein